MPSTKSFILTPIAACFCAGFVASAQAQVIDELEWRQEGSDAVAVIEFVTPVQYTKSISARASDLVQAFYTVLPTRETLSLASSERRLPGGGSVPSIIVRDESASATNVNDVKRKLVIRFDKPTRFKVRTGRKDNKSIEIVLSGLGPQLDSLEVKTTKSAPVVPVKPAESVPSTAIAPTVTALDTSAADLLVQAQSAFDGGQYDAATQTLNQLLNLPPNNSSRKAQELAGLARLNAGDNTRAASEFDLFLKLYPQGADSDRIRQLQASLPAPGSVAPTEVKPVEEAKGVTSGSVSTFYYGGMTDNCAQLADSPVGCTKDSAGNVVAQKQMQTSVDLNWRLRDAEKDVRMVFRDSSTSDFLKTTNKERLTALYLDYKSLALGGNVRVGRQSPGGGGVMYRFDGVQAGYIFKPKWKVNAVIGQPSDDLLDAKRSFYGVSVDAEALTKELSGSAFLIEQVIDGETDRRGLGADLRYFKGGLSASAQLDYDLVIRGLNVAAFQTTWQITEATTLNAMLDRRVMPMLSLGNSLFYNYVAGAKRIQDVISPAVPVDALRDKVRTGTPYQNQFRVGGTTTLSPTWQAGADFSLSSTDAVPAYEFNGTLIPAVPPTGNSWGVSAQMIGSNLYSARDTHVFNLGLSGDLTSHTTTLSYNNLSSLGPNWQLEPSTRYTTQSFSDGKNIDRWALGTRVIYRLRNQVSLESELTYERAKTDDAKGTITTDVSKNYYLGVRVDF